VQAEGQSEPPLLPFVDLYSPEHDTLAGAKSCAIFDIEWHQAGRGIASMQALRWRRRKMIYRSDSAPEEIPSVFGSIPTIARIKSIPA
jgi:hypothetical protein